MSGPRPPVDPAEYSEGEGALTVRMDDARPVSVAELVSVTARSVGAEDLGTVDPPWAYLPEGYNYDDLADTGDTVVADATQVSAPAAVAVPAAPHRPPRPLPVIEPLEHVGEITYCPPCRRYGCPARLGPPTHAQWGFVLEWQHPLRGPVIRQRLLTAMAASFAFGGVMFFVSGLLAYLSVTR